MVIKKMNEYLEVIGLEIVGPGPGFLVIQMDRDIFDDPRIRYAEFPDPKVNKSICYLSDWVHDGHLVDKGSGEIWAITKEQENWLLLMIPIARNLLTGLKVKATDLIAAG